jgi:hypothetical protein
LFFFPPVPLLLFFHPLLLPLSPVAHSSPLLPSSFVLLQHPPSLPSLQPFNTSILPLDISIITTTIRLSVRPTSRYVTLPTQMATTTFSINGRHAHAKK